MAWLLGTPTRTAVLTGAVLAQSAEFSFLLAQVGRELGAVSPTVFSLMLAAAAASIVLLPTIHQGSLPLADALHGRRASYLPEAMEAVADRNFDQLQHNAFRYVDDVAEESGPAEPLAPVCRFTRSEGALPLRRWPLSPPSRRSWFW